jgi:hypothetical protein
MPLDCAERSANSLQKQPGRDARSGPRDDRRWLPLTSSRIVLSRFHKGVIDELERVRPDADVAAERIVHRGDQEDHDAQEKR